MKRRFYECEWRIGGHQSRHSKQASSCTVSASVKGTSGSAGNISTAINAPTKPTWNGNQAFTYLEDMSQAFNDYRAQAEQYYASLADADGSMSVDNLKKQIKDLFPHYTMTNSKPKEATAGKHYLYIDDSQLQKMANDSSYRVKVYSLMERESAGINGWTLTFSDGQNKSARMTGSFFSLCEDNRQYAGADGIPYHGGCTATGDACYGSTQSHSQVRSQSFIQDNLDPIKSAQKDRAAAKSKKNNFAEQMAEKRKAAAKNAKIKERERQEQIREARKEVQAEAREKLEQMSQARKAETKERLEKLLKRTDEGKQGNSRRSYLDTLA